MIDALKILNEARKSVPVVKYALGVVGVAAAASLVSAYVGQGFASVLLVGFVFVGMILLFLFSELVSSESSSVKLAGVVLLWAVVLFFVTFLALTVSAFVFKAPTAMVKILKIEPVDPQKERIEKANKLVEHALTLTPVAATQSPKVISPPQRNGRYIDGCIISPFFPTQFGQQCRLEAQNIIATMYCRSLGYRESSAHSVSMQPTIHSAYVLALAEAPNESLDVQWQTSEVSGSIFTEIECR